MENMLSMSNLSIVYDVQFRGKYFKFIYATVSLKFKDNQFMMPSWSYKVNDEKMTIPHTTATQPRSSTILAVAPVVSSQVLMAWGNKITTNSRFIPTSQNPDKRCLATLDISVAI
jgi:hypothetical protein